MADARRRDALHILERRGTVPIGVGLDGPFVGHEVADITLHDIAVMLGRFELPARVEMKRVDVDNGRPAIVLLDIASYRPYAPYLSRPAQLSARSAVCARDMKARVP